MDPSQNRYDELALQYAVINGYFDIIDRLLEDPDADLVSAIELVANNTDRADVVKRLLQDPRADPSENANFAIQLAARRGHINIVKELMNDPRVDPSDNNNTALKRAKEEGHVNVVKELLHDPRVVNLIPHDELKSAH